MSIIVSMVVALLIAGFVFWALRALLGLVRMDAWLKQCVNVILMIIVGAIVLFYVVIPLIEMLGHLSLPRLR